MQIRTIQDALPIVTDAIKHGVHVSLIRGCLILDGMKPQNADKVIQWATQRARADADAIVVHAEVVTEGELPEGA